jgi:kynurenine formamidase
MPVDLGIDIVPLFTELVREGKVYDLAHPLTPGMPVYGPHPPYSITMYRRHEDAHARPRPGGSSFANEQIVTPAHVATHVDALGHFSRDGLVHGGTPASAIQSVNGLTAKDASEIVPFVRRAVLLDIARHRGTTCLEPGGAIGADELEQLTRAGPPIQPGDVVLFRTGWARHWDDPVRYNNAGAGWPGPDDSAARWLIDRGVVAAGSDTPAFEAIPSPGDSVHALLLVDAGIFIIENLDLEELAAADVAVFLFVAVPLPIVGATGSPIRPLALC